MRDSVGETRKPDETGNRTKPVATYAGRDYNE